MRNSDDNPLPLPREHLRERGRSGGGSEIPINPQSAIRNPQSADAGFTLIELGLVMLILGVILAITVPRFSDTSHADLVSQARRLAALSRMIRNEAILDGATYMLQFDLAQHRYSVRRVDQSEEGWAMAPVDGVLADDTVLPENVELVDVAYPMWAEKTAEGIGFTRFYPDGTVDYTIVHMTNGTEFFTIELRQFGQIVVADEYYDIAVDR